MTYTYTYTAAELQQHHDTVDDGEKNGFAIAPNLIKTSRLVVQGADGEPLPTNGTNTNYTAGVEVAFGCVAGTNIVNLTNDTAGDGGNWTATSGTIYFEVDIGPGRTIGDYFGSVMQADGTQLYAGDTVGIALTENNGKARLTVDFAQVSFSVWGISEQRGKLEYLSDEQITNLLRPDLLAARNWQDLFGSRSVDVLYTNNTPTEIEVILSWGATGTGKKDRFNCQSGGVTFDTIQTETDVRNDFSFSVQSGETYRLNKIETVDGLRSWYELRI